MVDNENGIILRHNSCSLNQCIIGNYCIHGDTNYEAIAEASKITGIIKPDDWVDVGCKVL
jgi:hypothetical protein